MPHFAEVLYVVAILLIIGADAAIFVAPAVGVYAFIIAAPLSAGCALIGRARYGTRQ